MTEEKDRELTREELRAQLDAEFNVQSSKEPADQEAGLSEGGMPQPENAEGAQQPVVIAAENDSVELQTFRESKDHLPIKQTWQVIVYGFFYAAFGVFLTALSLSVAFSPDKINVFAWFFIIFFLAGGLAAFYSSFDEFRRIKYARMLDKNGIEYKAKIADSWADNYQDGGILVKKQIHHLLYFYNDGKNYAKHAVARSLSKSMHDGGWITVEYLEDKPEIFRVKVSL